MFAAYYNYCWQTRKPGKSGKLRSTAAMMAGTGRARLELRRIFRAGLGPHTLITHYRRGDGYC